MEIVAFQTSEGYLFSAVDLLSGREDVNRTGFEVVFRAENIKEARVIPTGESLSVEKRGDCIAVKVPSLEQFVMIELK